MGISGATRTTVANHVGQDTLEKIAHLVARIPHTDTDAKVFVTVMRISVMYLQDVNQTQQHVRQDTLG